MVMNLPVNRFDNSRPLDVHKWSEFPEIKKAVNALATILSCNKAGDKKHLKIVLLDLYHRYIEDPEGFVAYSRNRNSYTSPSRYNKLFIRYMPLLRCIDLLFKYSFIEHKKGFQHRERGGRRQSRMRALPKLVELIEHQYGVKQNMIERKFDNAETVVLRDAEGNNIGYTDNSSTNKMRKLLAAYNELLSITYIDLNVDDDISKGIDFTNKFVYRIFNNKKFNNGGRFYGGWWQSIPRELRPSIVINHKSTNEYDYSGMHINMLYTMEGIHNDLDTYEMTYETYTAEQLRPLLKVSLLCILNADDEISALKAIRYEQNKDKSLLRVSNLRGLIAAFLEKHESISKYFYKGLGIELQYLDSQIAEYVIREFTRNGRVVLPIHDSFICETSFAHLLPELMRDAYYKIFEAPAPDIKHKGFAQDEKVQALFKDGMPDGEQLIKHLAIANSARKKYKNRSSEWSRDRIKSLKSEFLVKYSRL